MIRQKTVIISANLYQKKAKRIQKRRKTIKQWMMKMMIRMEKIKVG